MPSTIGFSSATTILAVNTANDSKFVVFPKASENTGRLLVVKDLSGTTSTLNPLYLSTITGDRFEGFTPTLFLSTYSFLRTTFPPLSTPMSFTTTSTYLQAYNPAQPFQSRTFTSDGQSNWFIKNAYTTPIVNSNQPQPTDISGLVLWFDADSVLSTPFSTVDVIGNKISPPIFFSTVPYLYTSFYTFGYGWIGNSGNSNGPPGTAYSNSQGTPGFYNPLTFPGSFPTGAANFNTYSRGYVFTRTNTFVQFNVSHDDGLHIILNRSTIYNNWTNTAATTNWAALNAGFTPIELVHQDGGGGCSLTVSWQTSNNLGFKSDGTGFFFGLSTITDTNAVLRAPSGGGGPFLQVSSLNGRNTLFFTTLQQMALFPARVYNEFSLFTISRLRNITNARVLQGTLVNSYYGYQGGRKNVLFLDNQVTDTTSNFNVTTVTNSNWDIYSVIRDDLGNAELFNLGQTCGKGTGYIGIQGLGVNFGTATSEKSVCDLAEIIVYNRSVNPQQRQQIEGYLAQKYGLTGFLAIGHPYSTQQPSTITSPSTISDIPNLRLWFDATQLNASNGQKISSLTNLAGTGEFMGSNSATSTSWPSFSTNSLNGYGVLDFTNIQTIFLQQPRRYDQHTVFSVTRYTGASNRYVLQGTLAATYYGYASGYNSWAKRMYIASENVEFTGTTPDTNWDLFRFSRNSNGIASFASLGSNVNRGYATVGFAGLAVGTSGFDTTAANASFCQLAEVLVYDRELSLDECFRIETYLSRKYNFSLTQSNLIQSTFTRINPIATPFVQSTISSLADIPNLRFWFDPTQLSYQIHPYRFSSVGNFSPSSISTIDAWYDASGLTNFGISTGRSTFVSTWYNRMSPPRTNFGKVLLQTSLASAPFYDTSQRSLFFNGQTRFMTFSSIPAVVNSTFSIFVMERRQTALANYFLGGTTLTSYQNLFTGYNTASNVNFDFQAVTLSPVVVGGYCNRFGGLQEPYRIWSILFSGLSKSLYLNGHFVGSQATTQLLTGWLGAAVGRYSASYYTGNVREMLFYNAVLSDADRQRVEGYLAWKWGTQDLLMTPTFISTLQNLTQLGGDMVNTSNIRYNPILISSPLLNNQNVLQFDTLRTMALNSIRYYPREYTLFALQRQTGFPGNNRLVLQSQTSLNYYGYNTAARKNVYIQEGYWIEQNGAVSDCNWDLYTFWKTTAGQASFSRFGSNINSYYSQFGFEGLGVNTGNDITNTSDCEVGEIIVYDRALSLQERSRVEKYIADKYNLTSNLRAPNTFAPSTFLSTISSISSIAGLKIWYDPSQMNYITHPFQNVRPPISTPSTLSSCVLWLDASGISNFQLTTSSILAWFDKSGFSNHASQSTVINRPLIVSSTSNFVRFDGATRFMTLNFTPNILFSDYTIFVLEQRQAATGYMLGGTTATTYQNVAVGYNASASVLFDVFGIGYSASIDAFSSRTSNEPFRIWCFRYGSNVQNISLNGYQLANRVLSNTNDLIAWLGAAIGRYQATFYTGNLREVVLYNTYLSDQNKQQMEGYFAWKWGLQSLLQSNTPVSTLQNLTGLPINMSNTGEITTMPYLSTISELNNRTVLQFTTLRTLAMNPQYNFSSEYSLFYLSRHTFTPSATSRAILQAQNDSIYFGYLAGKKNVFYSDGNIEIAGCNADGNWNLYTFQRDSNGIARFANFGSNINTGYGQTAIQGLAINTGADVNQSSDCFVGEILYYDRYLNIQECGQVEAYIANKYNLQSRLLPPNPQSNFFVQSTISSLAYISNLKYWFDPTQLPFQTHPYSVSSIINFSPSSISTIDCWYDASGTTNFVLQVSSIQTWLDRGPNRRHLSQATLINRPSYSTATREVVFNGATRFLTFSQTPGIVLSDYTIFVVEERQAATANYFLGGTVNTTFQNFFAGYNAANGYVDITSLGTAVILDAYRGVLLEPYRIWCFQYGQAIQQRRLIIDGLTYATSASIQDLTAWSGAGVGQYLTNYYTGNIREIIMYSNFLPDNQRQIVEGYLASKWRLQSNLMPFTPISTLTNLTQLGSDLTTQFATQLLNYPVLSTTNTLGQQSGTNILAFTVTPSYRSMLLNAVRIYPKEYTFFTLSRLTGGTSRAIFQGQTTGGYYGYTTGWAGTYRKGLYNLDGAIELTGLANDFTWDLHMFQKDSNGIGSVFYFGSNLNRFYTQTGFEGFGINTGTDSNQSSDCQVGEIMMFDRLLTPFERRDIERYYVNKYSLQGKYDFYNQTVQISTISSLSISSLQIWFDTTQINATPSTRISSFPNLITSGSEVMSNTTGINYPVLVSSFFGYTSAPMSVLGFSTTSNMLMTPSRLYSQFSLFTVSRHMPGATANLRRIWAGTTGDSAYGYRAGNKGSYFQEQVQLQTVIPANSIWDINCLTRTTDGILSTIRWNGSTLIAPVSTSFLGLENLAVNSNTAETSDCQIAEALIYNRPLLFPEVQEVEGYLANKYALTSNLPLTHPYWFPTPSTVTIDPSKLSSIGFWFDATNVSSINTITLEQYQYQSFSGNPIPITTGRLMHSMTDLVGKNVWGVTSLPTDINAIGVQLSSMNQPYYDTRIPSLEFRGNQFMNLWREFGGMQGGGAGPFGELFVNSTFTFTFVEKRTGGSSNNFLLASRDPSIYPYNFGIGAAYSYVLLIGYKNTSTFTMSFSDEYDVNATIPAFQGANEPFRIWTVQWDRVKREIFLNSSSIARTFPPTSFYNLNWCTFNTLGYSQSTNSYYSGYFLEGMVFNPCISTPQRWQAEAYLAWKYNLRSFLDDSNPFKTQRISTIL